MALRDDHRERDRAENVTDERGGGGDEDCREDFHVEKIKTRIIAEAPAFPQIESAPEPKIRTAKASSLPRHHLELQEIKKPSERGIKSINGEPEIEPHHTSDGKEKVAQEAEKVNAYLESRRKYSLAGYGAEQSVLARKYSIDAGTASLVGLHEISEEKLRKAIALGGLANPSLGVVDLNARAGTGFGAITLIAPRTLIDKKTGRNAGTYAGDAWTPMVPQVKLIGNEKTMKAADAYIDGRVGNPEIAQHVKTDTRAILSGRGNNQYLRYVFLKERGIPVPERVTPIHFPEGTALKVIDILGNESFFAFESELSDAQKRALKIGRAHV